MEQWLQQGEQPRSNYRGHSPAQEPHSGIKRHLRWTKGIENHVQGQDDRNVDRSNQQAHAQDAGTPLVPAAVSGRNKSPGQTDQGVW